MRSLYSVRGDRPQTNQIYLYLDEIEIQIK